MTVAVDQLVRVRNLGDQSIEGAFDGNPYMIRPGEEVMMSIECAKKDFGDWDARNMSKTDGKLRFRWLEYQRVRGLYGVHEGARVPVIGPNGAELDDRGVPKDVLADVIWKDRVPKVEILLMDGSVCPCVIDDPEGANLPAGKDQSDKDLALAALQSQMEQRDREMAEMRAAIQNLTNGPVNLPVDSPETAPRPQPKKAKVTGAQTVRTDD